VREQDLIDFMNHIVIVGLHVASFAVYTSIQHMTIRDPLTQLQTQMMI
jgi:hypothetical protein